MFGWKFLSESHKQKEINRIETDQIAFLLQESNGIYPHKMTEPELREMFNTLRTDFNLNKTPLALLCRTDFDIRWGPSRYAETDARAHIMMNQLPVVIIIWKYGYNDIVLLHEFAHVLQYFKHTPGQMSHGLKFKTIAQSLYLTYAHASKEYKEGLQKEYYRRKLGSYE